MRRQNRPSRPFSRSTRRVKVSDAVFAVAAHCRRRAQAFFGKLPANDQHPTHGVHVRVQGGDIGPQGDHDLSLGHPLRCSPDHHHD
jgi:hypothetical protein